MPLFNINKCFTFTIILWVSTYSYDTLHMTLSLTQWQIAQQRQMAETVIKVIHIAMIISHVTSHLTERAPSAGTVHIIEEGARPPTKYDVVDAPDA